MIIFFGRAHGAAQAALGKVIGIGKIGCTKTPPRRNGVSMQGRFGSVPYFVVAAVFILCSNSDGETSSTCVAIHQ